MAALHSHPAPARAAPGLPDVASGACGAGPGWPHGVPDGEGGWRTRPALNIDFSRHLRHSLCAPQDKYWGTAIWQEQSLGQEIERALRLIVNLKARENVPGLPGLARGAWHGGLGG